MTYENKNTVNEEAWAGVLLGLQTFKKGCFPDEIVVDLIGEARAAGRLRIDPQNLPEGARPVEKKVTIQ